LDSGAKRARSAISDGLFNGETVRSSVESLQARGQWGARDFDKVMFSLPIPRFNESDRLHNAIAEATREAETIAASVPLPENTKFHARGFIRAALTEASGGPLKAP
jgi:hypothetical protein